MSLKTTFAIAGAMALALLGGQPALAQDGVVAPANPDHMNGGTMRPEGDSLLPGRIGGDRNDRARQRQSERQSERRARPPAPPSPEEIKAAAQAQLTATGVNCQLTDATRPGMIGETPVYEATCNNAEGYILIASTPPQAFGCIELAGTAANARARDANADVGQQCAMPANNNAVAVIGAWAREAGATCTVDQAQALGKSDENNMIYEVGCAGADGYWLEKTATGWDLKDCLQIASMNGSCRFTTAAEQAQGFQSKLAGTDASDCAVTQVRMMGQNANGRFYEAKCSAEGQGFIARVNNEGVTQQVYACATAQRIGGGCTLTPAPAEAPAAGGRP